MPSRTWWGSALSVGVLLAAGEAAAQGTQPAQKPDTANYQVDIGGYGSFRLEGSDRKEGEPTFTLRRLVVTTDARLAGRFQVYSELEFERFSEIELERKAERTQGGVEFEQELEGTNGSEISLEQAWGQFNLTQNLGLRFGAVLPPVGRFNLAHDDNLWNFPRRPLIDRDAQVLPAPAAWTEMGLGVVGSRSFASGARLGYQAYLLTGTTLDFALEQKAQTRTPSRSKLEVEAVVQPTQGAFDGSNPADAVAARVELSPTLGSEVAVSGYFGRYTPEFLGVDAQMSTLGLDGRQKLGPFWLEGEFLYTRYADADKVIRSFAEAVGKSTVETTRAEAANLESEVEIELTGLADRRYGFWLDLSRPVVMRPGFLGFQDATLIPVARYERVWLGNDLEELAFTGGVVGTLERTDREQDRLSVGLAFRPIPQAVFHLTYERSHAYKAGLISPVLEEDDTARTVNGLTLGLAVGF